ncbi:MAG TPA: hypothetical protein DCL77_05810 [Prolixibacteraceae bacterium]|jgi:plastocyanin|nr:hypothetical protein [Prolixibacteraceae bacterium]
MKTFFTCSSIRTLFITFAVAISTLSLTGQTTHNVAVTNYKFTPAQLTITAGDIVVWTNATATGHNIDGQQSIFPNNPESFGNDVGANWTYQFTFNTPGTYDYHCDPHAAFGMVGSVIVNPSTTANEDLVGKISNIELYPNPASQYIQLLVPANYERINSLKVYSVVGTLIDQKVLSGDVESFRYDVSGFKNGAYFVEINSESHKAILKFLKY